MSRSVQDEAARIVPSSIPPAASLPPALKGQPFVGMALRMRRDPLPTMLRAVEALGDTIAMKLGPYHATLIRNPDDVRRVFVDNADNYTKQTRGYQKARLVLGDGLVTSEGETWQRQRRIATPAFNRQRVAGFAPTMVAATEQMLERWKARCARSDRPIDVFQEMMKLTLRIALQTLLGITDEEPIEVLSPAVTEILERANDIITNPFSFPASWPTPKNRRLNTAISTLERFVYQTIAQRRAAADAEASHDLLGILMNARDEQSGGGMSDRQLRDEAVTILIAGHETTANALSWALYLLSKYPDAARAVRSEAQAAGSGRSLNADDLPNLPYCRAVIEETMRLYPPAWMIGRAARHTDTLGSYTIPGGTFILISPYVIHRHPGLWDNPERFDPARFLDGRSDRLPKFAYLPFGGGQRFCIGSNFALMETTLVLATILRTCVLEFASEEEPAPYAMITLRPKNGVPMRPRFGS